MTSFTAGATTPVSCSVTTANGAFSGTGKTVRLYNAGLVAVFFKLATSSAGTAAATDTPLAPGVTEKFTRDPNLHTHIAALTASSTATLYATVGDGE